MSLFICDKCKCVDNTNCNHPPYDMVEIDPDFPNMHSMEMAGFDDVYQETGVRGVKVLLCSECNTGKWHNEFPKKLATEAEIIMGAQLEGDEKNIFTFHPLWPEYDRDPENFDVVDLKKNNLCATRYRVGKTVKETIKNMRGGVTDPYVREEPKISRNDTCPCGSNKKYKKCCSRKNPAKQQ